MNDLFSQVTPSYIDATRVGYLVKDGPSQQVRCRICTGVRIVTCVLGIYIFLREWLSPLCDRGMVRIFGS